MSPRSRLFCAGFHPYPFYSYTGFGASLCLILVNIHELYCPALRAGSKSSPAWERSVTGVGEATLALGVPRFHLA